MGGTHFYSEIAAYCELMHLTMDPWDIVMLRRLYRLNIKVLEKPRGTPMTEASDGGAVAGLMRGLGAKKAKK